MNKLISVDDAVGMINDGMTIMVGGFLGCKTPFKIVDAIVAKGVKDITLIKNDSSFTQIGIGKLIVNRQVKKLIASHVRTNKETGNQINAGEVDVELVPQGTLAERIRAACADLGGAMDLVTGAKKVIVAMNHTAKDSHKILKECKLPLTALNCVDLIITEMGVIEVTDKGLVLREIAPDVTIEEIKASTGVELLIAQDLKVIEA